jgi:hypothetical protein
VYRAERRHGADRFQGPELRYASGYSTSRNLGGAIGIAVVNTWLSDNARIQALRFGEALGARDGDAIESIRQLSARVASDAGSCTRAAARAGLIGRIVSQESLTIAFNDVFRVMAWMFLGPRAGSVLQVGRQQRAGDAGRIEVCGRAAVISWRRSRDESCATTVSQGPDERTASEGGCVGLTAPTASAIAASWRRRADTAAFMHTSNQKRLIEQAIGQMFDARRAFRTTTKELDWRGACCLSRLLPVAPTGMRRSAAVRYRRCRGIWRGCRRQHASGLPQGRSRSLRGCGAAERNGSAGPGPVGERPRLRKWSGAVALAPAADRAVRRNSRGVHAALLERFGLA